MKMRSVRYLVGEGISNVWVNRLMSLASIGVLVACMVVIGLAVLISENVRIAIGNIEQQNVIMVYMKDYNWALYDETAKETPSESTSNGETAAEQPAEETDKNGIKKSDYIIHDEQEAKALCDKIAAISSVEKVEYVSSDEGLEAAKSTMLENQAENFSFLNDEYGNPLSSAAKVSLKPDSDFKGVIAEIEALDGVDTIQSHTDLADKINAIKKGVYIAGIGIMAILIVISLVIVSNTIRVTMYNRKLEISIMKAVGATDAFVRLPFVVEGMLIGIISAGISVGLLYCSYRIATETLVTTLQSDKIVAFGDVAWGLVFLFLVIGVFAGVIGSMLMIGKYLRKEGSEFTAI